MPRQMTVLRDRPRSETHHQVASEVRAWLARRRISANRAAQELGWSQSYMSKKLNGRQALDLDDLEQLADLLDVDVREFFDAPIGRFGRMDPESLKSDYVTETLLTRSGGFHRHAQKSVISFPNHLMRNKDTTCNTGMFAA